MKKLILCTVLSAVLLSCSDPKHEKLNPGSPGSDHHHTPSSDTYLTALHAAMESMMTEMHRTGLTGDADHDFALLMRSHHQSAVKMAKILVSGSRDSVAVRHAQHTIAEQESEVRVFDTYLQTPPPAGHSGFGQKALERMSEMSDATQSNSLETTYAGLMIIHHNDGVEMAQDYLKEGKDKILRKIAASIIITQPKEIAEYRKWMSR